MKKHLPQLTGLRAIAAGGVVIYHATVFMTLNKGVMAVCHLGVPFFFVLSGFILSHAHEQIKSKETRRFFWFARFARIWPLTMACLILTFLLIPFESMIGHSVWPVTLPLNILLMQAWFPMAKSALSFNGIAWTLSVEAFFYILFPFLKNICLKSSRTLILIILPLSLAPIGIASLAHVALTSPDGFLSIEGILIFFPPCRLFEFGIGLMSYKFWAQHGRTFKFAQQTLLEVLAILLVGVIAIAIAPAFPKTALGMWFSAMTPSLGFGILLPIFASGGGLISQTFALHPIVFLGETSFALYLSHQLLLRALCNWEIVSKNSAFSSASVYFATVYLASWMLWKYVEAPSRRGLLNFWRSHITSDIKAS